MVKQELQNSPVEHVPATVHLYSINDPIPVPEAFESDTDTAWGLWEESVSPPSNGPLVDFENTVPAGLPPLPFANFSQRPD